MTEKYRKDTPVRWRWGAYEAKGRVMEAFTSRVTRTIEGAEIVRNADEDNPAYLIEQEDGGRVLKSHSELKKAR